MGPLTGRVLDYITKNKRCASCDKSNGEHNCRENHTGSSKAMEGEGAVTLFKMRKANLNLKATPSMEF